MSSEGGEPVNEPITIRVRDQVSDLNHCEISTTWIFEEKQKLPPKMFGEWKLVIMIFYFDSLSTFHICISIVVVGWMMLQLLFFSFVDRRGDVLQDQEDYQNVESVWNVCPTKRRPSEFASIPFGWGTHWTRFNTQDVRVGWPRPNWLYAWAIWRMVKMENMGCAWMVVTFVISGRPVLALGHGLLFAGIRNVFLSLNGYFLLW